MYLCICNFKVETEKFNKDALKEAKKMYSSSMIAWLSGKTPFADSDELTQKHYEVQKTSMNDLKARLKGPNEFAASFTRQLEQVSIYFRFILKQYSFYMLLFTYFIHIVYGLPL